jgi:RNA polymerase sigma-70 factor (ECF subfamily)
MWLRPAVPVRAGIAVLLSQPRKARAEETRARPATPAQTPLAALIQQRRLFLRFLERRIPSPALAEDILQSAYLRALEHEAELRAGESSTAWFYRILRNAVIDFYRRRKVEDRALDAWANELETEVAPNELMQDLVCRCVAKVLPLLPPNYSAILQQVDLEEVSLASFASRHRITPANAAVRVHRARKALKQRLIETCGACAIHRCLHCNCIG